MPETKLALARTGVQHSARGIAAPGCFRLRNFPFNAPPDGNQEDARIQNFITATSLFAGRGRKGFSNCREFSEPSFESLRIPFWGLFKYLYVPVLISFLLSVAYLSFCIFNKDVIHCFLSFQKFVYFIIGVVKFILDEC